LKGTPINHIFNILEPVSKEVVDVVGLLKTLGERGPNGAPRGVPTTTTT
jgi:hypothetical protein